MMILEGRFEELLLFGFLAFPCLDFRNRFQYGIVDPFPDDGILRIAGDSHDGLHHP
jgi:hypothetical protein